MINAPLIFKINNYVKSLSDEQWDFRTRSTDGCPTCWLGNASKIVSFVCPQDNLKLGRRVFIALLGFVNETDDTKKLYGKSREYVSKEQVCNLVDRYP